MTAELVNAADKELNEWLASGKEFGPYDFVAEAITTFEQATEILYGEGPYVSSCGMGGIASVFFETDCMEQKRSLIAHLRFLSFPGRRHPNIDDFTFDCIADDGEYICDAMRYVTENTKLRARCDSHNGIGLQRFWIRQFTVAKRWQGKGLGYIALHHALMASGAQGQEVFAFPMRSDEKPEEDRWKRDFWIGMDRDAIYLDRYNVVYVPAYNKYRNVHLWHENRPKQRDGGAR